MAFFYHVPHSHVALALFTSNTPGGEKLKLQCFDIGKGSGRPISYQYPGIPVHFLFQDFLRLCLLFLDQTERFNWVMNFLEDIGTNLDMPLESLVFVSLSVSLGPKPSANVPLFLLSFCLSQFLTLV